MRAYQREVVEAEAHLLITGGSGIWQDHFLLDL